MHDGGDAALLVNGKVIAQPGNPILSGWKPGGKASFIEGAGGKAYDLNVTASANTVKFEIGIMQGSPDLDFVRDLAQRKVIIPVKSEIVQNLDKYASGVNISRGASRCALHEMDGAPFGSDEAKEVKFEVFGIDIIWETKK